MHLKIYARGTRKFCSNLVEYTPPLAAEELFILRGSPCRICDRTEGFYLMTLSFTTIILWMVSRRLRWAGHVACLEEGRGVHKVLVGKPE